MVVSAQFLYGGVIFVKHHNFCITPTDSKYFIVSLLKSKSLIYFLLLKSFYQQSFLLVKIFWGDLLAKEKDQC
jgi:hypothetical protein